MVLAIVSGGLVLCVFIGKGVMALRKLKRWLTDWLSRRRAKRQDLKLYEAILFSFKQGNPLTESQAVMLRWLIDGIPDRKQAKILREVELTRPELRALVEQVQGWTWTANAEK